MTATLSGRRRRRTVAVLYSIVAAAFAPLATASPPVITDPPASQTVFIGDVVTFRVGASGTTPLTYQWLKNEAVISGATTPTLGFATSASDQDARFAVRVSNPDGTVTSAPATLTIDFGMPGLPQTDRWLEITNVWRYHVGNVDLGAAWTTRDFSDAAWGAGGGLLYVETGALPAPKTTALPFTPGSLPTTAYFRTWFTNAAPDAYSIQLVANTVIDDGVACYVNGSEVLRLGLPEGAIGYSTNANRTVGDATWEGPFELPATSLVPGANLFAAEVHQSGASSTDLVLGFTLDAVWRPRLQDVRAPTIADVIPPAGSSVAALTQIQVRFDEAVSGVDAPDFLINGVAATNVTAVAPDDYLIRFPAPPPGPVNVAWAANHQITDRSVHSNAFAGAGFGYLIAPVSSATRLPIAGVSQSTDASAANSAAKAVDGVTATHSLTADEPGSYWLAQLARPFPVERVELLGRPAPSEAELGGLTLRLYNLDDQVVFETALTHPAPGGFTAIMLPPDTAARSLWIGLPGSQTNAAGNHRVGLAEVRLFGLPNIPFGPEPVAAPTNSVSVWQSSDYGGFPASNAVDIDTSTFTHTADVPDSFWMADLGRAFRIDRVELVNRSGCCDARLDRLVLRLFDAASNSVASAVISNPGLGATWTNIPPANTLGRWIRVGLENGQTNGHGNHYVTLAEARVFSGRTNLLLATTAPAVVVTNNLASMKPSWMLRLDDSVPAASRANDDRYTTETRTTERTVDGYWEVDLENTYALYGVRAIAASGIGSRLTNTIVRLFNAAHESVHAQKMAGAPDTFDVDLNGPVFARYVRVGLEDKQRTDPAGGIEFYIGFREVEVFGRPTNEVGILSFTASTNRVQAGETVTLSWAVDDVRRVEIRPAIGSAGASTAPNGVGHLTLALTNSTEFVLLASNAAGTFSRAVSVAVDSPALPVRLSELVAENKYSLKDGDGDAPDWIELRNTGDAPVDLSGWGLSDDPAQPMKWTFPATNVAPHGTLIVFASGRDNSFDPAGHLHAGFRLEKNGGTLVLTARDGRTTLDRITYPELDADLAYGRDLEGNGTFLEPTPGAVNAASTYLGWLKEPDWSHTRGFHETGFTLTLGSRDPGTTLLYSLNGSVPSLPYSSGLAINRTSVVRAQAVRPGYKPARVQTRTFLFLKDVITSSVMNKTITQDSRYASRLRPGLSALPSISLVLPGQPEYEEKEGSFEILWPRGGDPVQVNCGLARFGNAWTKYDKRSFRVNCRPRYGAARLEAPLFDGFDRGVPTQRSFDTLDLRSGSQDMNERGFYMAGRFVEDSMLDMGSLNPHGRFVHVYVNGVYWGQYDCRELFEEHFLADYLGGATEDYVAVRGNDNVGDDFVPGLADPPHLESWEQTRSARNSYAAVRSRLDVSHLIDFMLLWNYGDSESEFRAAGPINPGSGFKFWIADADGFLRTGALGLNRLSRLGPGGLFGGLVAEKHPDFKTLLADRIYQHFFNDGALTPKANDARLAGRMQEIRDSLVLECARWGYRTPANWESAAAAIRSSLFPTRTSQLLGYLRSAGLYPAFDPPAFNPYGGVVTNGFAPVLTSASGTIYYTLDGSDPRLPGGTVAPGARIWSPGVATITSDLTLTARVRSPGGVWSALAQPRYFVAPRQAPTARDLLVTELHYNPVGSDDFEFIELWNASTNLLDLSGVSLGDAVRFVFPNGSVLAPGAFVIITEDTASFAERYQTPGSPYHFPGLTVAGNWTGALDNTGETLSLVAASGIELSAVPFKPTGDWPARADGKGSSLELRAPPPAGATDADVRALLARGRNWTASSLYHGSPGRFDDFVTSVRINEVLSHSEMGEDWIELFNAGHEPVDLGGCTLTDDLDRPARWEFPTNTTALPGGFLVLTASQLGFAFSELGDEAHLLQMDGANVIRFLDGVDLPATTRQESLGTFPRSGGAPDFTELRANTPGGANALPRVGPVVISEIMVTPPAGKAQFLELANLTNTAVPLFDLARPTNVWQLQGVGSFAFPAGTVVEPCATVIVCSTNPAAFHVQYAVSPDVPVFGPWTGVLDGDGETLTLLSPGTPELDGTVPYYRVDHVSYRADAPWPQTSTGLSLERASVEAYGNAPESWRVGMDGGTPGIPAANRPPVIHVTGSPVVAPLAPLTLTLSAEDADAPWQTVSLSAVELPVGSDFDPVLGVFSWTPSEAQGPGNHLARFTAADTCACGGPQTAFAVVIQVVPPLALTAELAAEHLLLRFAARPGETYVVEYCADLTLADWQLLQEVAGREGQVAAVPDAIAGPGATRFYRLRWVR